MKEEVSKYSNNDSEYCICDRPAIYADTDMSEFGYYYRCSKCNKRIDDEIHYYNHYDGEDHDDVDLYNY